MRKQMALVPLLLINAACSGKYDLPPCPTGREAAYFNAVAPDEMWDDGQSTMARFRGNTPIPAVYFVDQDGNESLVESTVSAVGGDHIITVHGTAPEIHFRKGKQVACVVNNAWNPAGYNPSTGTTSPDVMRVAK